MKKFLSPVFSGITEDELTQMEKASCLRERGYGRNEWIFRTGDLTTELGIVLSGSIIVENTDVWGNVSVLTTVQSGGVFAETYALCRMPMMVEVTACEESRILFVNTGAFRADDPCAPLWHRKMIRNLLEISARKNLTLSGRMFCISPKTVRGRVLAYLSSQAHQANSDSFRISLNRQQMADYLNVDRTALSKELGKMRNERLIDFYKNEFTIHTAGSGSKT